MLQGDYFHRNRKTPLFSEFVIQLMNTKADKIFIIELYSITVSKRFPKPIQQYEEGWEVKFGIFFLQRNCICDHVLSPDFLSLLHLVPGSFYLSRNQNKIHLILLEVGSDVKARCLFQDHGVGSQANILSGFVWNRVLKSLRFPLKPQTQRAHLKFISAVLRSMESPTRVSHKVWTWSYYWNQYML